MTRPERIKIIGKRWRVRWDFDDETAYGLCDINAQTIHCQGDLAYDMERDTVLHEVVHAIDDAMDTGLSEDQVRRIATGLLAVIADNPGFIRYLRALPKKAQP